MPKVEIEISEPIYKVLEEQARAEDASIEYIANKLFLDGVTEAVLAIAANLLIEGKIKINQEFLPGIE